MKHIKSRKHAVTRVVPHLGSAAAAATLLALALPVAAQTSSNTLKEVQVQDSAASNYKVDKSANTKFTAPLLDTPQTIAVIREQIIREQGATTLSEALRNTPGASAFYLGENGSTSTGDAIYMRGYDASSSIFVDGIRDLGSISRDVFNVEQIEVVKGPAGTDVGRTSPTGYINLITKKPQLADSFSGSVGVGSADYKRGTIDWNKSLTGMGGNGAFRLNAITEDAGIAGRDDVKNKRWGIAPSLALGLNTPTRLFFDYVHVKQDNVPDGGVPTIGLPGYTNPDSTAITQAPFRRTFLDSAARVNSSNFYGTRSDFDHVNSDMFTARFEHDITSDVTLRNTLRYGKISQDYMLTSFMGTGNTVCTAALIKTTACSVVGNTIVPNATAPYLATPNPNNPASWTVTRNLPTNKDQVTTVFANQTNVSAKFTTGGLSHTMNAGLELMSESQKNSNYYGQGFASVGTSYAPAGSWPAANLYNPDPNVSGYNRIANGTGNKGTTDTVGAYVFDTLKFNEQWSVTGGLRYDHYSTDYDATALTLAGTGAAQTRTIAATDLSMAGKLFTGKLGVVYKPAENGSIYAAYGTAAQPPGGANFSLSAAGTGNSAARTDFEPQKSKTVEVGTKWDTANKKLSFTAAVYRTDVSNQVVQDPITTTLYYQTGKQRVQGIELGVSGAITNAWGVSAGFTTMDTKIVSGPTLLADKTSALAYTPKNAFTSWTTYQLPLGFTLGGGVRYNGALHRGTDGAVGTPAVIDGYWVLDAMATYRINKNFDLQLNVYNVTDKDYVAAINKSGYRYSPSIPRSARITANFAF